MRSTGKITYDQGILHTPDHLALPYIPGDGIGPEVMSVALRVAAAAVQHAYRGNRSIEWFGIPAGQAAQEKGLDLLPEATIDIMRSYRVGIKGPT